MLNKSEINFFKKNGYLIKKSSDQVSLNKIQDLIFKYFFKSKKVVDTKKRCYATDEIYNREFPEEVEIKQWAKEFNESVPIKKLKFLC